MQDIMQELKPIGERYAAGDFQSGLALLHELWARLPAPKPTTPNAYMVIEYGVAFALKLRDLNDAWVWANRAPEFKEQRQDRGEVEFLIGKVAYEDGKCDIALAQFREANQKSRGRVFVDSDPKYAAFLKAK